MSVNIKAIRETVRCGEVRVHTAEIQLTELCDEVEQLRANLDESKRLHGMVIKANLDNHNAKNQYIDEVNRAEEVIVRVRKFATEMAKEHRLIIGQQVLDLLKDSPV